MKIVYAGTPEFAVAPLKALIENGFDVVAVVTQEDRPVGRKAKIMPPPVKVYAQSVGVPVYQFAKIKENVNTLQNLGADVMITCAYGQILTQDVLDAFGGGVWNIHASLLPLFRGASPIQSAILAGEKYTGVTVMKTELTLDTGDILIVKRCETGDMTAGELSEKLSCLGAEAILEGVKLLENGDLKLLLQDDSAATYCKKIEKCDAKIDFNDDAQNVCRLINAMNPAPVAYCNLQGKCLNVYKAVVFDGETQGEIGEVVFADRINGIVVKCGNGAIKILQAQPFGGKVLLANDLINGRKITRGNILD